MGFGAGGHGVHVAFVVDLQVVRLESLGQFGSDRALDRPAPVRIHVRREAGQRPARGQSGGDGPDAAEDSRKHRRDPVGWSPSHGVCSEFDRVHVDKRKRCKVFYGDLKTNG
ncbi:hypothetical protein EYF80_056065 [Liparis tanakae]|uniref:Uncharacterized protein n=1 Tax=Liparis tanakae TaxID=230148 RepID=A0A4Z2EZG4_9TELE|nr:hypothetical protein EYF80_056065 [Liparis tanakae]